MQDSKYILNSEDKDLWQQYITYFLNKEDAITPKYTYNDINSRKLDLHGLTINNAWIKFKEFIEYHYYNGTKNIVVITGKSGQISKEFVNWCDSIPLIKSYEPLTRRNGAIGSYRINFKQANNATS